MTTSQNFPHLKSFKTSSSFYSTIPETLKMDSSEHGSLSIFPKLVFANTSENVYSYKKSCYDHYDSNICEDEANLQNKKVLKTPVSLARPSSFTKKNILQLSGPSSSFPASESSSSLKSNIKDVAPLRSPSSLNLDKDKEITHVQYGYSFSKSQRFPIIYGDENNSSNVKPQNDKYCPSWLRDDNWRLRIINNYIGDNDSRVSNVEFSDEIKRSSKPTKIIVENSTFIAPRVYLEGIYNRDSLRDHNKKEQKGQKNSEFLRGCGVNSNESNPKSLFCISQTLSDDESDISDIEDMNITLQKYTDRSSRSLVKTPTKNQVAFSPKPKPSSSSLSPCSSISPSSLISKRENRNPHSFSFWHDDQEDETLPPETPESQQVPPKNHKAIVKEHSKSVQTQNDKEITQTKNPHFSGFTQVFSPTAPGCLLYEIPFTRNEEDNRSQVETIVEDNNKEIQTPDTVFGTPKSFMNTPERLIQNTTPPTSYTDISSSFQQHTQSNSNTSLPIFFRNKSKYFSLYDKMLFELIKTEITYRDDLVIVKDVYMKNLKYENFKYIISQEEKKKLFGNLKDLINLSNSFIDEMLSALKSSYVPSNSDEVSAINGDSSFLSLIGKPDTTQTKPLDSPVSSEVINLTHEIADSITLKKLIIGNNADIGNVLIKVFSLKEFREGFMAYISSHKQQEKLLKEKLNHSKEFAKWHECCINVCKAETITTSWDLESLLIKPVQRLLKYKLLVKSLLDKCEDVHNCFSFQESLDIISYIADDINKNKSLKGSIIKRFEGGSVINFPRRHELLNFPKSPKTDLESVDKASQVPACIPTKSKSVLSPKRLNFRFKNSSNISYVDDTDSSGLEKNLQAPANIKNLKSFQIRHSQFNNIPDNRIKYVDLTLEFKRKYTALKVLHDDVLSTMKALSDFRKKNYKVNWNYNAILVESEEVSNRHNINEKCSSVIKNTYNSLNNQLLIPMQRCQKICDNARDVINEEREYRIKYYENNNNINKKGSIKRAANETTEANRSNLLLIKNLNSKSTRNGVSLEDKMVKNENFLMEKLPEMNLMLDTIIENVGYNYLKIINEKFNKDFINSIKQYR